MVENSENILVVDDDLITRKVCQKILNGAGYLVETAADGFKGLEVFTRQHDFSAALIDLNMPQMDGLELIERLHGIDPDLAVLVITAYGSIESAVEAVKRGAFDYIQKPFETDVLLLPLRNALNMRALTIETRQLRQEREQRLLEVANERSRLGTIIDCMSDAVIVVNREAQIVFRNTAALRTLPWRSPAALPCPLAELGSVELRRMLAAVGQPSSQRGIISSEITLGTSTYMASTSPVNDSSGAVLGGVAVLRDITALKELAAAKSMFISMVAHELKSPLAVIESYLSLVLSPKAADNPAKSRSMVERSLLRARAMRELIEQLLTLQAMSTGRFTITRAPLNLCAVLAEIVKTCKEKADAKKITLAMHLPQASECPHVLADSNAMQRVFINLIENAITYTPEGGHVSVDAAPSGHHLTVSVKDDGIGLDPSDQKKIFDEFYRVRNAATADIPGTGLGLSLVKNMLDLHHGSIDVTSSPGKGSIFTVSIPLATAPDGGNPEMLKGISVP